MQTRMQRARALCNPIKLYIRQIKTWKLIFCARQQLSQSRNRHLFFLLSQTPSVFYTQPGASTAFSLLVMIRAQKRSAQDFCFFFKSKHLANQTFKSHVLRTIATLPLHSFSVAFYIPSHKTYLKLFDALSHKCACKVRKQLTTLEGQICAKSKS